MYTYVYTVLLKFVNIKIRKYLNFYLTYSIFSIFLNIGKGGSLAYGSKLKELIKERGFSQKQVAALLAVSETTFSGWCTGEYPPLDAIERVCNVIGVPIYRVFVDENEIAKNYNIPAEYLVLIQAFQRLPENQRLDYLELLNRQLDLILKK